MLNRLHKSGHSIPNLVIAQRVIDKMVSAAGQFIEDETGEAMVGLLVPGTHTNGVSTLYVLDTIAPDDSAVRLLHTFQQGDERQDELIWWLQENWHICRQGGRDLNGRALVGKWDVPLRYLGDWHKQPGFMIQPSQGDLMTARRWIADEDNGTKFLLAPIVTLGHPSTTVTTAHANFLTVAQGDDTCIRVDFWYLDLHTRDFTAISPSVYPNDQLPGLVPYPWHLVNAARFDEEYRRLSDDGLFTALVLWNASPQPPLEVCLLTARMGVDKVLLLITPWDFPSHPPSARVAPFVEIEPDEDMYSVFEELWAESEPVADPPGWKWSADRRLVEYVRALESALGIKPVATSAPKSAGQDDADSENENDANP